MGLKRPGSKGKLFREQGPEDSGHCIKESHTFLRTFPNILLIQGANERNLREQGDGKNN